MTQLKSEPNFSELIHRPTGKSLLVPGPITQSIIDSASKYQAKSSDIFVCAYPKCGTTWLQNIVWLIVHNGESFQGNMRKSIPMLEFDGCEVTEAIDNSVYPRIIKTHFRYCMTPQNPNTKYIYITRNPKDALVSFYYHLKGFRESYLCPDVTINNLFPLYVAGKVEFNLYFDHVAEWYSKRDEANVLFLLYEDLKRDLKSNVMKIAKFLGSDYEEKLLANNEEVLKRVLEKSSFESMRNQPKNSWVSKNVFKQYTIYCFCYTHLHVISQIQCFLNFMVY